MGFCNSISSVAPDGPNDEPTVRSKPKKRGWGLKKKTQLFTKVYGLKVRVRMVRPHHRRRATESRAV